MSSRIEDVKEPVIGKFYIVPCVWEKGEWLPVIGPWHEDAEIVNFPEHHFHYDWRFMPERQITHPRAVYSHGKVATWPRDAKIDTDVNTSAPRPTEYKRKRMRREMIEFPCIAYGGGDVPFVRGLEEKYRDHVLKCRTCPHRGMSLDGLPADDQGRVVCNGHGLRWNLNTSKLAPRLIDDPKDPRQVKE